MSEKNDRLSHYIQIGVLIIMIRFLMWQIKRYMLLDNIGIYLIADELMIIFGFIIIEEDELHLLLGYDL
jgi:hypothetical protein